MAILNTLTHLYDPSSYDSSRDVSLGGIRVLEESSVRGLWVAWDTSRERAGCASTSMKPFVRSGYMEILVMDRPNKSSTVKYSDTTIQQ
jgi:hypothetical protein